VVSLLDSNVLIALFDPAHVHHEQAHQWFAVNRKFRWATCPLTENAFLRILTNSAYPGQPLSMEDAVARLRTFCSEREHVFWPGSVSLRERGRFRWAHVQDHRQVTGVYLLALAIANNGRLATLDPAMTLMAIEGAKEHHLELITI
jgi:toxin-antitoxin system PIN domain toxin